MGTVKSLQATLRNLTWQTKSIASGDFSHRVDFLGEFSDSFNSMVKKLKYTINEVNEAKALFELFFETIPDATMIVSFNEWSIFNCNHAFEALVGLSKDELLGKRLNEISFYRNADQEKLFEEIVKQSEKPKNFSLELKSENEEVYHGLLSLAVIYIDNEKYILSVIKDITERKMMEEEIRRLTEIDRLTQLYNRLKLDTVLMQEIERSRRSNSLFAIILLDIDNFKRVNDEFGHIAGDEVLKQIAEIIKANIRKIDTAGRWGGEEFMIILPESDGVGGQTLAEKIRLKINEHHFTSAGNLTASFGVAEFDDRTNEIELVSRADKAMYQAKHAGKNQVFIFDGVK